MTNLSPTPAGEVEVTQADRDAAWPFRPEGNGYRAAWDAGTYDHLGIVQAFAWHRISSATPDTRSADVPVGLKPCPFCGNDGFGPIEHALHVCHSQLDHHPAYDVYAVQCDKCTATMGHSESEEEAIEAWNTRAALTTDKPEAPLPAGQVLVPVEPTDAMKQAGEIALDVRGLVVDYDDALAVYRAMLAAAPSTPDTRSADVPVGFHATVFVSPDGSKVQIEHKFEADWFDVMKVHVALRDWAIARIAGEDECPFKPSLPLQTSDTDWRASSDIERDWIALSKRKCETIGLEDVEPGCCAPCRARTALNLTHETASAIPDEPTAQISTFTRGGKDLFDDGPATDKPEAQVVRDRVVEQLVVDGRAKRCSLNAEQREAADDQARAFYRKVIDTYRTALSQGDL